MKNNNIHTQTARMEDAEALLQYMHRLINEKSEFIPLLPEELPTSIEEQAQAIASCLSSKISSLILATEDDQIIGRLDISGHKRNAISHIVLLGISVDKRHRRQGIAKALMQEGFKWIKQRPCIKRVEIEAHTQNIPAITLYKKLGFEEEGISKKRVFHNDKYEDTIRMALLIN